MQPRYATRIDAGCIREFEGCYGPVEVLEAEEVSISIGNGLNCIQGATHDGGRKNVEEQMKEIGCERQWNEEEMGGRGN